MLIVMSKYVNGALVEASTPTLVIPPVMPGLKDWWGAELVAENRGYTVPPRASVYLFDWSSTSTAEPSARVE
jgi:hypothetical protein